MFFFLLFFSIYFYFYHGKWSANFSCKLSIFADRVNGVANDNDTSLESRTNCRRCFVVAAFAAFAAFAAAAVVQPRSSPLRCA